jgi:streptogramin lyase
VLRLQICAATRSGAVWITSTDEQKIAKLDERTGEEIFRKPTWGYFPNRTSVAADGSVWVTNRDSGSYIHLGADGEPICSSEYDLCQTRAAAVDPRGHAWIGCHDQKLLIEVSDTESSGTVEVDDQQGNKRTVPKCKELRRVELGDVSPYGLVAGPDGALWVGVNTSSNIVKVDSETGTVVGSFAIGEDPKIVETGGCWSPYGITIDPDGNPWYANYGCGNVVEIDGATGKVAGVYTGGPDGMHAPRALGVDPRGHVWVADNAAPYVNELEPDGTWVKRVELAACGGGSGLLGTGSDSEGHIWTVSQYGNKVAEYDVGGTLLGCYPEEPPDFASPYTYSDFTGSALAAVSDRGRITVTFEDAAVASWLGVALRAAVPAGTSVCVRARTPGGAWSETWCPSAGAGMLPVSFPADARPAGARLEVELQLASSDPTSTPLVYSLGAAGTR